MVAHAVELHRHRGETADVRYDERIPESATGNLRQVDIGIHIVSGGRRFLHTVEVQNRGNRMGLQAVDAFLGKAAAIGAHRTTLVASKGFTKSALERIATKHSDLFDAVELRPGRTEEWPGNWGPLGPIVLKEDGEVTASSQPGHLRYMDALAKEAIFDLLLAYLPGARSALVIAAIVDAKKEPGNHGLLSVWVLGHGDPAMATVSLDFVVDGKQYTVHSQGQLELQ
ncbi:MAG TPA: restriction endonuclease [Dehalococcoidia bacterium]